MKIGKYEKVVIATSVLIAFLGTLYVLINGQAIYNRIFVQDENTEDEVFVEETQNYYAIVSAETNENIVLIYLTLSEARTIAGAELNFKIDENTIINEIKLSDEFDDLVSGADETVLKIEAARSVENVETSLDGKILVATISYSLVNVNTDSELYFDSEKSTVQDIELSKNILEDTSWTIDL